MKSETKNHTSLSEKITDNGQKALKAFEEMRRAIAESGIGPMTLEEINAEIKAARIERKKRNK